MEETTTVQIGKYTYESNPEDKQIPDFFIQIRSPAPPLIRKLIPDESEEDANGTGVILMVRYTYDVIKQHGKLLPLTYSTNPFIVTPTK
jgi:hypothetical protein